jgi:hypothetical protein
MGGEGEWVWFAGHRGEGGGYIITLEVMTLDAAGGHATATRVPGHPSRPRQA